MTNAESDGRIDAQERARQTQTAQRIAATAVMDTTVGQLRDTAAPYQMLE